MNQYFTPYQEYPIVSIAELITLLPILIGLFHFYSSKRDIKLLIIFFVCFFIRDILSNKLAYAKENNLFIYNLFSFVELSFLALIFYTNDKIHSVNYKRIIIIGFMSALIINLFFYSTNDFSPGNFTLVRLYGMVITITFFGQILSEVNIKNILTYSMFWINSGLLLFFCGTFFIFLLSDKVLSTKAKPDVFQQYWDTNLIFYIVLCVLSSVGIWLSKHDEENLIWLFSSKNLQLYKHYCRTES